jgi:hypothetical protein
MKGARIVAGEKGETLFSIKHDSMLHVFRVNAFFFSSARALYLVIAKNSKVDNFFRQRGG